MVAPPRTAAPPTACAAALTSGHDDARDGDAFRKLVQQDSQKEQDAELAGDQKTARDRDAIEEGVQREPKQCGPSSRSAEMMGFLAEVEMGREDMLGQVDGEVPDQDVQRCVRRAL